MGQRPVTRPRSPWILAAGIVAIAGLGGCSLSTGDVCETPTSSALLGGAGTLSRAGVTSDATGFSWTGGGPDEPFGAFAFVFGDERIDCSTLSKLGALRTPTPLAALVSDRATGSACQIVVGAESLDWTGGTIVVVADGGSYTLRLDAAATLVGDETVELSGLTGTARFESQSCSSGGGGWWL